MAISEPEPELTPASTSLVVGPERREIISSVLIEMLFHDFPVNSLHIDSQIHLGIMRSDEEADELIYELLQFIDEVVLRDPRLAGFDLCSSRFNFVTTGPIQRFPVLEHEWGEIVFPAVPTVREGTKDSLYLDESYSLPTMHVTDITASGLTYFFSNQTNTRFMTGADFNLYVREGDMWRYFNHGILWVGVGKDMPALRINQPRSVEWAWLFDDVLPPGEYKFTKNFSRTTATGGAGEQFIAEQRFIIE